MAVNRILTNILSDRLPETRDFFTGLLGLQADFEEDWYVHLSAPGDPALEVAVWRRDHGLIPEAYREAPRGTILTFVVDDVDAVHERAVTMGATVVSPPRDRFYGQRSCLVLDPNGLLVDVSTPVP
ncbi:VOC family protein [Planomonospora venezuelensis]|uniref:PhnB protein n=1 Tax=Planomonospora venezuelensis TaxID=1999 RepID=A0A841DAP3_PLAVE|nr:VOC family protein [Planomonospora venezuelensis]MBB5965524.1 PhnB protein [Planomonospora venezuelensis]GIN03045.1 glyoxalase [Planomonospora venezuelensis]